MKQTIHVDNIGKVTLTDKQYLASGGEANVYAKDETAFKIYHDSAKMIPVGKIQELSKISAKNVLKPQNIIRDNKNKAIGYTMRYLKTSHPLCKLFTKAFKQKNNISDENIVELIKEIQITIAQIHSQNFLIVDLNELNVLVSYSFKTPYFIDTDSWQCDNFYATAIMESIRDPLIKHNKWNELSDWYSFAILAFQLLIGIHPFRGRHPNYNTKDMRKRMEDGVSVFDRNVTLPRVCNDFSVIPTQHREWFESLFIRNERSIPPMVDGTTTVIAMPTVYITGTADFEASVIYDMKERIMSVFNFMGIYYIVGTDHIYKEKACLPSDIKGYKVEFCESSDMTPIVCKLKDNLLIFETIATQKIGQINASQMMYRDGAIYSIYNGHLTETTFDKIGPKIFSKNRVAANVSELATKVFDGVLFQDLLGKCYITLPYEKGKCVSEHIKELDGYRILEARSEKNICGVMAEKKGKYYRFIIVFDKTFISYAITKVDDVTYAPINLTVMPNGVCIMIADSDVHMFKGSQLKVISDPPFDSSTKLFNISGQVFFIDDKKIYSVKMKK
jgi:hypothetical protein